MALGQECSLENRPASAQEVIEKMAECWDAEIPDLPLPESKYSIASLRMASLMVELLEQDNWQDLAETSAIFKRAIASYDPMIDHLYRDRDGRIIDMKFVFRGGDDERKHPALSVARESLRQNLDIPADKAHDIPVFARSRIVAGSEYELP